MKKLVLKRKGFTLVEVIIVLVILAILAAMLIPSLTGYIDKAEQDSMLQDGRNVLMAVQAVASEEYANGLIVMNNAKLVNWAYNSSTFKNYYTPKIKEYYDFTGYTLGNINITKYGKVAGIHVTKYVKGKKYDEIEYLNCTRAGVEYDGEWIINTWHGEQLVRFIDPAH